MDIYLIRHGESLMNTTEGSSIVSNKAPLTDKGYEQAFSSAEKLREYISKQYGGKIPKSMTIWHSPAERAIQTFNVFDSIFLECELNNIPVMESVMLSEQSFGVLNSIPREKWEELWPHELYRYQQMLLRLGYFYTKYPCGESPMDVTVRSQLFLNEMEKQKKDIVLIFTHGTVIRTLTMLLSGYDVDWYEKEESPGNAWIRRILDGKDFGYIIKPE